MILIGYNIKKKGDIADLWLRVSKVVSAFEIVVLVVLVVLVVKGCVK
jgi:hypothetical protein